jgi:hypothetical protein
MSTSQAASTGAKPPAPNSIPYKPIKLVAGMMGDEKLRILLAREKVCMEDVKSQLNTDDLRAICLLNRLKCGGAAGISRASIKQIKNDNQELFFTAGVDQMVIEIVVAIVQGGSVLLCDP